MRETDLDSLEKVVGVVAFGDVDAEGPSAVADVSLRKLLQLSQLANQYLLHVQDHLALQNGSLKAWHCLRLLFSHFTIHRWLFSDLL